MYYDGDQVAICGDLNARLGNKRDLNSTLDDIILSERNELDDKSNRYGDYLVDFLVDSKCYVTNGRGDRALGNYTSVSKKGKAVVHYVIVSYSQTVVD